MKRKNEKKSKEMQDKMENMKKEIEAMEKELEASKERARKEIEGPNKEINISSLKNYKMKKLIHIMQKIQLKQFQKEYLVLLPIFLIMKFSGVKIDLIMP